MGRLKTVFIAHPISGDIEGNIKKVLEICKGLNSAKVLPIFPSFLWRQYLPSDGITKHIAGLVNNEYFERGMVDEVWLFGETISEGMKKEIYLAQSYGIPIIPQNEIIEKLLKELLAR